VSGPTGLRLNLNGSNLDGAAVSPRECGEHALRRVAVKTAFNSIFLKFLYEPPEPNSRSRTQVWTAYRTHGPGSTRPPHQPSMHSLGPGPSGENGGRVAQKMQVGPCIPVEIQLEKGEVGPTSGPTWRLCHLVQHLVVNRLAPAAAHRAFGGIIVSEREVPHMLVDLVRSGT
jgi:hypothetical protein